MKIPSEETLELRLKTTDTIENIKTMIQNEKSIPLDQQQLMFGGKQLVNCHTVSDCSIKNGSTLYLECK